MNVAAAIALFVLVILAIIYGPLITIWALNLIFGLSIPSTFWTWLATLWLMAIVGPKSYNVSK